MKILLLIVVCLIFNANAKAQNFTDFTWQHPQYGGHSLNEVKHISGQTFIAVGDQGMLLTTYDNGQTWSMKQQQTLKNFKAIWVRNPDDILVAGSFDNSGLELYRTINGGETWNLTYSNNALSANDMQFPTDSIGYIVGNIGKVLRTEDAGNTWADISNASINGSLQSVWFTSPDTGFAGRSSTFGMYKTTNGGLTWSQNFGYYFTTCYSMHFLNDTLGFAGAFGNAIFRTTNGGDTWSQQSYPQLSEYIRSFDFADSLRGMAVAGGYIYKTINGGTTWSSTFYTGNLRSGALSDDGHTVVTNLTGGIKIGNNYGASFTEANPQAGISTFRRVRLLNNTQGWVGGDEGKILKTSNGGETWQLQTAAPYYDYIADMAVLSASKVLVCTEGGQIVSTSNGGTTFTTQTIDANGPIKAIHFPSSTVGYACGNTGKLWKTTNGGTSFSAIPISGVTQNLLELHFPSVNVGYVIDEFSAIRKTTNGGTSFSLLSGSGVGSPRQIWFLNDNTGYLINSEGDVFRTTNGSSFEPAGSTCMQTPFDFFCLNDSTCFAVGSFTNAMCDVSFTANRGQTWTDLTFPFAYAGWGVHALDTSAIWIVGQNQTIIRRELGGVITSVDESPSQMINNEKLTLYPNPSSGMLQINSETPILNWQLFDMSGRVLLTGKDSTLNISHLTAGLYQIRVMYPDGRISVMKLLKE
jgi:photosystem II stability/assembly factor-like uncharacterized protein